MAFLTSFICDPALICLLCALVLLGALYFSTGSKNSACKLPPGPSPLPIIGNLHLLDIRRQDKSLMKLGEEYGPVFTLHFGFQKVVVLTGYEAVKEALVNFPEEFVDRPAIPIFEEIQHGNGVFFSTGELWRTTRRFTMSTMRNLGMGKQMMEEKIFEELHFLTEMIKSHRGEPFSLRSFNIAPTNIIFLMLFGERFDYKDPMFLSLLRLIDESCSQAETGLSLHLPPHTLLSSSLVFSHLAAPFKQPTMVDNHRPEWHFPSLLSSDATWSKYFQNKVKLVYLKEKNKKKSLFHDENLVASILDLVMAGTETTATTLQWTILLMMKYPEIQKKVQEEIGRVVEPGSRATYEDRRRMPFTNAVIHEVQRFITLLPHVPRCTAVDTHFRGYLIPKGTTVIPSLTSVLLDKTQWETPYEFNPNHFLDTNGKFVKKDAFLAFSSGRRNCIGESLAKMELFLFFVGLLQTFTFRAPPGVAESDLDLTPLPPLCLYCQPCVRTRVGPRDRE
uniref:Cytochrome P450 2W1-like n=1 Tax=Crocodylus porosus TaxID=8502 RepID=A0A7M4FIZ6_CROPO